MTEEYLDPADRDELDAFKRWLLVRAKLTKNANCNAPESPYWNGQRIDEDALNADKDFFRTYAGAT